MATGNAVNAATMLELMGRAVRASDPAVALAELENVRDDLTLKGCEWDALADVRSVRAGIESRFAYLAGYMPSEMGNKLLGLMRLTHPLFGKTIPAEADQAMAAGLRLASEYQEMKLAEERRAKRAEQLKKGLDVPGAGDTVASSDAKKLLESLRKIRGGAVLPSLSGTAHTPIEEEAPRPVAGFNAMEVLLGKDKEAKAKLEEERRKKLEEEEAAHATSMYEEEEEELEEITEEDVAATATPRGPAITGPLVASAEEKARLVAENESAGEW
jgi:hypothetical protein